MKIKVVIVDDHRVVRQGLQTALATDPDIEIVAIAINGLEGVQKTREFNPDVVLMDITMPVMDGYEATSIIRQELPYVRVLILSFNQEEVAKSKARVAGAAGYLVKGTDLITLIQAIKDPQWQFNS